MMFNKPGLWLLLQREPPALGIVKEIALYRHIDAFWLPPLSGGGGLRAATTAAR